MKKLLIIIAILSCSSAFAQHHGFYRPVRGYAYHGPVYHSYYHPRFFEPRIYARPYYRPYWSPFFGVSLFPRPVIYPPVPVLSVNVGAPAPAVYQENVYQSPAPAPNTSYNNAPANAAAYALSDNEFERAKSSIYSKSSDNNRLAVAKEVVDGNYLSATQVREVMGMFSSENARLEFAKYAYPHTVDRNNYYVVNDALGSESAINDLNNYISSYPR